MSFAALSGRFPRRILRFLRMDRQRRALVLRAWALLWEHRVQLRLRRFRMPALADASGPPSPLGPAAGPSRVPESTLGLHGPSPEPRQPSPGPDPSSPETGPLSPDAHRPSSGGRRWSAASHSPSPGAIGWAVTVAAHLVPGSTCLVRALAAQSLCRRFGYDPELRLGARRDDAGELEVHAWLELDDEVLIGGGQELTDYTLFTPITDEPPDPADP